MVAEMGAMRIEALSPQKKFDESAVPRAQAEKWRKRAGCPPVEMARVRNQMYRLLTPEQQAVLNESISNEWSNCATWRNGKVHR